LATTHSFYSSGYWFSFIIEDVGSFYYVHVYSQPSYGYRNSSLHLTHRLSSSYLSCTYRICFNNNSDVFTLRRAKAYADRWAKYTVDYIKHGRLFQSEDRKYL